jgi:2-pyrone-4,6-dicarboxylate lactonase
MLATSPERLLWGSDWPHTNREAGREALEVSRYREIDPAAMRQERMDWLNPSWAHQILVRNPARLYQF